MLPNSIIDDIYSNRSLMAVCLEHGKATAPPVDLRAIPREEWDRAVSFSVALPEPIAKYLAGHPKGTPLSVEESEQISDALEKFYDITAPYFVVTLSREDFDFYLEKDPRGA